MASTGYVGMSSSGCLLPMLIILNLVFGKLIFGSTGLWLGIEAVLILVFIFKVKLMISKISRIFTAASPHAFSGRQSSSARKPTGKVIDVQGQEVKDEKN